MILTIAVLSTLTLLAVVAFCVVTGWRDLTTLHVIAVNEGREPLCDVRFRIEDGGFFRTERMRPGEVVDTLLRQNPGEAGRVHISYARCTAAQRVEERCVAMFWSDLERLRLTMTEAGVVADVEYDAFELPSCF